MWHKLRIAPGAANPTLVIAGTNRVTATAKCTVYKSTDAGATWAYLTTLSAAMTADVQGTISGAVVCGASDILELRADFQFTILSASPGSYRAGVAAPAKRAVIISDSIGTGATGPALAKDGWHNLLGEDPPGTSWRLQNMSISGYGVNAIGNAQSNADLSAAHVLEHCDGVSKNVLIITMGVNDWGNGLSLAAFTNVYTMMIDRYRVAMPSQGLCIVTPLIGPSNDSTVNGAGVSLAQCRSAITTILSGYSDKIVVDGLAIMTNADQVDGVHPNEAGMIKFQLAVKAALLATWGA
jgi:lysophospholipase L1-like esterase